MTRTQVHETVAEIAGPDRAYSVEAQDWRHQYQDVYTEYAIAVIPGFDDSKCQRFCGRSIETCIEKLKAEACKPTDPGPLVDEMISS